MHVHQVVAVLVAVLACVSDLRSRRIPNVLTLGGAIAGLGYHLATAGAPGGLASAGGLALGFVFFLPFFLLRGLGAGDVKLAAALGAWLGPRDMFVVAVSGAIAGGALAIVVALAAGYLRTAFRNLGMLFVHWRVAGIRPLDSLTLKSAPGPRLPYAVPLACGVIIAVWMRS
jgi:prepilin peptidase CpaA